MGNRSLFTKLMGTTALVGGALAGGMLSASDALAQARLCPASSLTGTGNVSNAVCNAAGTPIPFTLTLNVNEADWAAVTINGPHSPSSGVNVPTYANSGGPGGGNNFGFSRAGWVRFTFDAPAEGDQHYGFHFRYVTNTAQQTSVTAKQKAAAGAPNNVFNNSVSHAPTPTNREWFYWKSPQWGQIQFGSEGSGIPGVFMAPANEGPPGSAIQTLGPGTGIESIVFTDTTTGNLDAGLSLYGSDAERTKGALGIRYISPNFLGSSSDYGFKVDVKYTPDGHPYNDGNFATDHTGASGNSDLGESNSPKNYMSKVMNIVEATLTWEELFAKDWDVTLAAGGAYGTSKGGDTTIRGNGGIIAAPTPGGVGQTGADHKANQDLAEGVAGASVVWREALTVGGGFTYSGKSLYPANTPAYIQSSCTAAGCKIGTTNPAWGASVGVEYDWDRYQVGAWYQYATQQGDMNDQGYIQIHYIGVAAGMNILKDLKAWTEVMLHSDRNNHSDAVIAGGACGDPSCRRSVTGVTFLLGTSLDF